MSPSPTWPFCSRAVPSATVYNACPFYSSTINSPSSTSPSSLSCPSIYTAGGFPYLSASASSCIITYTQGRTPPSSFPAPSLGSSCGFSEVFTFLGASSVTPCTPPSCTPHVAPRSTAATYTDSHALSGVYAGVIYASLSTRCYSVSVLCPSAGACAGCSFLRFPATVSDVSASPAVCYDVSTYSAIAPDARPSLAFSADVSGSLATYIDDSASTSTCADASPVPPASILLPSPLSEFISFGAASSSSRNNF